MATGTKVNLVAIIGPTASGKSALAMEVAKMWPIEIIAADSRTIYKGMDIGTAKASQQERVAVPHWGLDIVEPGESFSAKGFQDFANQKIREIRNRAHLPVLVGGTGLYVDSVVYNFSFVDTTSDYKREELEAKSIKQLQSLIADLGYTLPDNSTNKRHLIRQLERGGLSGTKTPLPADTLIIGLMPGDEKLKDAIDQRARSAFADGILEETRSLLAEYGENALSQTGGILYKICIQVLKGELSEQEAIVQAQTQEWQYARRQRTWFRRNKDITWFEDYSQALSYLKKVLNT